MTQPNKNFIEDLLRYAGVPLVGPTTADAKQLGVILAMMVVECERLCLEVSNDSLSNLPTQLGVLSKATAQDCAYKIRNTFQYYFDSAK